MTFRSCSRTFAGLGLIVLAAACSSPPGADAPEAVAQASAAITQVPGQVLCLEVLVAGSTTSDTKLAVTTGESSVVSLTGLPVGAVTFTAYAYPTACTSVTTGVGATWLSNPVAATLTAGTVTNVTLEMHLNGESSVGIDFPGDAGEPAYSHTITVDGNLSDWNASAEAIAATDSATGYVTWDATNVYFALASASITTTGTGYVNVYIGGASGGTSTADTNTGGPTQLPANFEALYHVYREASGATSGVRSWNGTSWVASSIALNAAGGAGTFEASVTRAALGLTGTAPTMKVLGGFTTAGSATATSTWPSTAGATVAANTDSVWSHESQWESLAQPTDPNAPANLN
jgi:hypothetical protein